MPTGEAPGLRREACRPGAEEVCLRQQVRHHTWSGVVMEMTDLGGDLPDVSEEGEEDEDARRRPPSPPEGLYIDDCPPAWAAPGLGGEGHSEGPGGSLRGSPSPPRARGQRLSSRTGASPTRRQGSKRLGSKGSAASSRPGDLAYFSDTDSEVGDYTANCPFSPLSRVNDFSWMQRCNSLLAAQPFAQAVPEEEALPASAQQPTRPGADEPQHLLGGLAAGPLARSLQQHGGEEAGPQARSSHQHEGGGAGPPARRPQPPGGGAAGAPARGPRGCGWAAGPQARLSHEAPARLTWSAPAAAQRPAAPGCPAAHATHAGAFGGGGATASILSSAPCAPPAPAWPAAAAGAFPPPPPPPAAGQSSAPDWAAAEPAVPLAVPPLAGAAPGPFAQSPCAVGGWQTGPGSTSSASQSQSASASRRNRRRGKACVKPQEPPDPGCITTVMVRNLPEDLPQQDFMSELASTFGGTYNFAYLPRDFSSNECKGYAFVNFVDPADASRFRTAWHETRRFGIGHFDRPLDVSNAHIQGYEANVAKAYAPHACNIRNPNYRRVFVSEEKAACAPSEVPGDAAQLGEAFRPAPPAPPAPAEALAGAGRHGAGGALLSTSGGPGGQPGPPRVYQPRLPMEMHPAHIQVPPYAGAGCRPEHYAPSAQRPRPRETSDSFQMARQVAALSSRAEAVPGGLFRRGAPHAGAAGPL